MPRPYHTVFDILVQQAASQPNRHVFTLVSDRGQEQPISYQDLDRRARAVAVRLQDQGLAGQRVLILCPSGLDYIVALFGCFYAGAVAVPAYPPRLSRSLGRLQSIVTDSQAVAALTTATIIKGLEPLLDQFADLKALRWVVPEQAGAELADRWTEPHAASDALAMLQYTSGSTLTPRGVMLSHANLLHNSALISRALGVGPESQGVFWLPLYHDLGLIGGVLQTIYAGSSSTLMSPVAFIQKPIRWLEAISRSRGTHSSAPTIGYELCVREISAEQMAGLDLSSWRVAIVGAEPVRAATLRRFADKFAPAGFRPEAFTPCYGLAEATVFVTGTPRSTGPVFLPLDAGALQENRVLPAEGGTGVLAGCGQALEGVRVEIVDPATRRRCEPDRVGEIWVAGPSVALGYWNQPDQTAASFQARLDDCDDGPFLRTGDLGFVRDGELFVTGRLKELIILAGRNHYPQDLEQTVEAAHPLIRAGAAAAFSVETETEERVVVAVEVERGFPTGDADAVFRSIRQMISEEHEVELHAIALVRAGQIPRTSSGKIQRGRCRELYQSGTLEAVAMWTSPASRPLPEPVPSASRLVAEEEIQNWLIGRIGQRMGLRPSQIDIEAPFTSLGLNSLAAVQIASEMEVFLGQPVSPTLVYYYPTIEKLAQHLAGVSREDALAALPMDHWPEPIAIVGMGCRLPGAPNVRAYWELLQQGRDALREMPSWRWGADVDRFKAEFPALVRGGFMDGVDQFEPEFFGILTREAGNMDPQQRILLEVAWEALEDAGLAPARLADTRSGVFLGISSSEYLQLLLRAGDRFERIDAYMATGNAHSIAANRLSYLLNLHGPSFAVDTACSSALVAVHLACRSLLNKECDLALAAGVNICLSPDLSLAFSRAGMLSPDGICKVFDRDANGYVRGEGCGVVVLRRLSDALAAGEPILALIRGSAINQDGRTASLTAPSGPAQQAVIRQALACAGLRPTDISYVEAHGTGTSLGDPIEVNALAEVYGADAAAQPCALGSVKANIGHLEAASGIAGLIKTVLVLQNRTIPPQPHFRELNPLIHLAGKRLGLRPEGGPWTVAEGRYRAAQNSFGFGGTNAHVILEEAPTVPQTTAQTAATPLMLPLSARSREALADLARAYLRFLDENPQVSLVDLCHAAAVGRNHWEHRLAIEADSLADVRRGLRAFLQERPQAGVLTGEVRSSSRNGKAQGHPEAAAASLAERYVQGSLIDWLEIYKDRPRARLNLPTYPFQRRSFWPEEAQSAPVLLEIGVGLGSRPEFKDHQVGRQVVTPAAAYVEFALAAARQLGGGDWLLEDVKFQRPLVLAGIEDRPVRVVSETSGNGPARLKILSQSGTDPGEKKWAEHASCCPRLLGGESALVAAPETLTALQARIAAEVPTAEFYRRLSYLGLDYGPAFRGVQKLWLGTAEALGFVQLPAGASLAAQLDACLQVAAPVVPPELLQSGNLVVPAGVERLRVSALPPEGLWCWARRQEATGTIDLLVLDSEGQPRAQVEGLRLQQLPREMLDDGTHNQWHDWLYHLDWRPAPALAVDYLPPLTHISERVLALAPSVRSEYGIDQIVGIGPEMEQVSLAYVIEAFAELGWEPLPGQMIHARQLADQLAIVPAHHRLLARLLDILAEEGILRRPSPDAAQDSPWEVLQFLSASPPEPRIRRLQDQYPSCAGALRILQRCGSHLAQVLRGQVDPLTVLFPEGSSLDVEHVYQEAPFSQASNRLLTEAVLTALQDLPPDRKARILEVGAGTGGTTACLLKHLPTDRVEYVFTDVSPLFLPRAREKFASHPNVRFQTLDIEQDPAAQSLEAHSFDVVIAANVLHATADLQRSLEACRKLLAPQGLLVLLEWVAPRRWVDITFGLTEGWWKFADLERRPHYPLMAPPRWLEVLDQAGFADRLALRADEKVEGNLADQMLLFGRAPARPAAPSAVRPWVIFADAQGCADALVQANGPDSLPLVLVRPGTEYGGADGTSYTINAAQPEDYRRLFQEIQAQAGAAPQAVLYLWTLDIPAVDGLSTPALEAAEQHLLGSLLHLVKAMKESVQQPPRLWFCSRGVHALDDSAIAVSQAPMWGFGRALVLEQPELRCTAIDLDPKADPGEAARLWLELLTDGPELQLAYRCGQRHVARLVHTPYKPLADRPLRLVSTGTGTFNTLEFQPFARQPLGPGEVEIRVAAAGLNFHDVLDALGLFPYHRGWFGGECAGTVTGIGPNVEGFALGDAVVGLAPASFASVATTRAALIAPKPVRLSFEEAATIPVTFLTSYYALERIAGLQAGERVLIHSAAGGVGLAAVQLAQLVGAEIFATAGNPEKRAFLESLGIRHVFDSRSLDFAAAIRERTGGAGVDVVLNSLTGEAIGETLALLQPGGRFVEIGRIATWTPERVASVRPDVAYTILPLDQHAADDPATMGQSLRTLLARFEEGKLQPLPRRVFPAHEVTDGFRWMASAKHIGKIVLSLGEAGPAGGAAVSFGADGTYLIVGGLGGLGLQVAKWLADRGARSLALVGRSAQDSDDIPIVNELRAAGVQVRVAAVDVSRRDEVARLLESIDAQGSPLRGVIHSAGVLDDAMISNQNWDRFARVLGPKVSGAWNLHELTRDRPLEHFVVFSSMAGLVGSPGQANHASANAFLDALIQERHRLGLPATSINWGAWAEVGAAVKHVTEHGLVAKTGKLSPAQGIDALEWTLGSGTTQVAVWPVDWAVLVPELPPIIRPLLSDFAMAATKAGAGTAGPARDSEFIEQLRKIPLAERRERLLRHITEQVADVLQLDTPDELDPNKPLQDLGFDSLTAVEMRNVLQRSLNCPLPTTLLFEHPTLGGLADYVFKTLNLGAEAAALAGAAAASAAGDRAEIATDEIAVIGLGCRFPGGANSPEQFWQLLQAGFDAVRLVPTERWDNEEYYDPDPDAPGKIATRYGAFVDRVDTIDAEFFEISPREAAFIDPQQRLLLEVAWEALENAGQAPDRLGGTQTGVFVGLCNNDYSRLVQDQIVTDPYGTMGNAFSVTSGRVSYLLGLQGPSMVLDTACSSSLVAVHLACQSLLRRESDLALAGGVNLMLSPYSYAALSRLRLLSPDGRCKAFSADADGFGRGEGCGVVVLKRLADARAAGDRILAVIRGSAVNQDGRSAGLAAPNARAQEAVLRKALEVARLEPAQVGFIEAHGTGTELGDPIEVSALAAVYGPDRPATRPLLIGSVKSNVAHLEAAAGVVGLMKAVLTVHHGLIPASLHSAALNAHIPWNELPIKVTTRATPWPDKGLRVVGVSSFGISGTNAHILLQEERAAEVASDEGRPPYLLTLSAKAAPALQQLAGNLAEWLEQAPGVSLADFCWTLNAGRARFAHRLAFVAESVEQVQDRLRRFARGETLPGLHAAQASRTTAPKVAFLYLDKLDGWVDLVRDLAATEPAVQAEWQRLKEQLGLTDLTSGQERRWLLAGQLALTSLWRSWGVAPTFAVGRGPGLLAAAVVAGLLKVEDAGRLLTAWAQGPDAFTAAAAEVAWSEPRLGLVGDDGAWLSDGPAFLAQWNAPTVEACTGMQALHERGCDRTVTIGLPGPSSRQELLEALAELFVAGVGVDPAMLDTRPQRRKLALPTYPFQRRRFWLDTPATSLNTATRNGAAAHPLLGQRLLSPLADLQFEARFGKSSPGLKSLGLRGPALPSSISLAFAQLALETAGVKAPYWLENVEQAQPLALAERGERTVQTIVTPGESGRRFWKVLSHPGTAEAPWTLHARGDAVPASAEPTAPSGDAELPCLGAELPPGWHSWTGAELYERLAGVSVPAGRSFAWLEQLTWSADQAVGWWRPPEAADEADNYPLHPGILEGVMQLLAPWFDQAGNLSVPTFVRAERITYAGRPQGRLMGHARLRQDHRGEGWLVADVSLTNSSGDPVLQIQGLHVRLAARQAAAPDSARRPGRTYEITWRPAPWQLAGTANGSPAAASWRIVADPASPLAKGLSAWLQTAGHTATVLTAQEALAGPPDADGQPPSNWIFIANGAVPPGTLPFTEAFRDCGALQELVQSLIRRGDLLPRFLLVTQGAQAVGSEKKAVCLRQAPLWGLVRHLAAAHPDLPCGLIDLCPDEAADAQVRLLVEELVHPDGENQIAFRRGRRLAARLVPSFQEPTAGGPLALRAEGIYLIVNGLSGPGLEVARWLSEKGARHLVLTGKTATSAEASLAALRDRGVTVTVDHIDPARRDDLAQMLARCDAELPLRGVIHMAGLADDTSDASGRRRTSLIAPKAAGAFHLHELTVKQPLDFFILFSGASALLGSDDPAGHAAANAFLDGLAWHRRASGLPALAINWGPWDRCQAMAGGSLRYWQALGIVPVAAPEMLAELETLLQGERTQAAVFAVDWLRVPLERLRSFSLLREMAVSDPAALPEALMFALRQELLALNSEERKSKLLAYLDQRLSRVAGLEAGALDHQQPLNTLGLDSIMALDLLAELQEKLQVRIPVEKLLEGANLEDLAAELARSLDAPPPTDDDDDDLFPDDIPQNEVVGIEEAGDGPEAAKAAAEVEDKS